jgi:hypothetical protein
MRHHLLISGTGRAGTTFLVQLFTELGLDTGFASLSAGVDPCCFAGMEHSADCIIDKTAPYVVKSPGFCEKLEQVMQLPDVKIDFLVICVRDLFSAAESRRRITNLAKNRKAPGGLWGTRFPREQEAILARKFYELVYTSVKYEVPTLWLSFPRIVSDPEYLYTSIRPAIPATEYQEFLTAFGKVSNPEFVHSFKSTKQSGVLAAAKGWIKCRFRK